MTGKECAKKGDIDACKVERAEKLDDLRKELEGKQKEKFDKLHKKNNELQINIIDSDKVTEKYKSKLDLVTQSQENMEKGIEDIKKTLDDNHKVVLESIRSADDKYASKEDLSKIEKFLWGVGSIVFLGMGAFIWDLITNSLLGK